MTARSRLRQIGRFLMKPGVLLTLGTLFLAVVVWFVAPLIIFGDVALFGPAAVRLVILLVLALFWGVVGYFLREKRTVEDAALLAALRRQQEEVNHATDRESAAVETEFAAFRDGARKAMQLLRRSHRSLFIRSRYALPWYLVLGADGSGKTALARTGGLTFPSLEREADAGGTRFHVADQAVIVEVAGDLLNDLGRYDHLWPRMLAHLKRLRPRQPLNGIVVTLDVQSLAAAGAEANMIAAQRLRRRLDEAALRLRVEVPVYLVLTKFDLVVGFDEFFDTLNAEERANAFGLPLAADLSTGGFDAGDALAKGFSVIAARLAEHQFLRLQEEGDERHRRRIFEFPGQFAHLKSKLAPVVADLAATHRFGAAPNLRGLFFVSAHQGDPAADLLATPVAAMFGRRAESLPLTVDQVPRRSRPYFLAGLWRHAMLAEADLGGLVRPARVAARVRDFAINAALVAGVIALVSFWWLGFTEGRAYTARISSEADGTRADIVSAMPDGGIPSRFEPVLEVLDRLKILADEEPRGATLGLYGTGTVRTAAREAYDRALGNLFFPFVWRYLREGLGNAETPASLRFRQLRVYLMLTGKKPAESEAAAQLGADFAANWMLYERTSDVEERISAHFAELATVKLSAPPADPILVDKARARIADYTLARLAYDMVLMRQEVRALDVWRPVDHMGLAGPQALVRSSGASFWDGIPGIFTKAGYSSEISAAAGASAKEIAADLWVMGEDSSATEREREAGRIRDGLLELYRVDYIAHWDSLLSDISIAGGESARTLADSLAIVAGPQSPVRELMAAVATETNLSNPVLSALAGSATAKLEPSAGLPIRRDPGRAVTEHFKAFRDAITAPEGQKSPVDVMLAALEPLYGQLNHVATGGDVLELGAEPQTLLNQLSDKLKTLPPIVRPFFARTLTQAGAITGGSSRERLAEIFAATVQPLCDAAIPARYPFDPKAINDTSLDDFARLFGPKGALAAFRNDYLKPYIDTTTRPWRWRSGQQLNLNLSDEMLKSFEAAANVTTVFFGDQEKPSVEFVVEVGKLDAAARAFILDIGGPVASFTHGPPAPAAFKWPPENPASGAAMSMTPEIEGSRNILSAQGPWALFRLFGLGRVIDSDPTDTVNYLFRVGNRQVLMRLTAPASRNPFARNILAGMTCPALSPARTQ